MSSAARPNTDALDRNCTQPSSRAGLALGAEPRHSASDPSRPRTARRTDERHNAQ